MQAEFSRREFLKLAGLGLGGVFLPQRLRTRMAPLLYRVNERFGYGDIVAEISFYSFVGPAGLF